ncbi:arylesterase [Flagellimonas meridianipacifica]|uniref:Acyl-CoA thioesterase-1 n=1 Tax=Flagellimonas meridianipacifica TaxID=1080225 RepID=A0A2T0MCZ1_9FLAO|nr:arylesterase [Allomuricauda pacifica]PRX55349.1 acyl-CoA thioesterase-1 [Allomuricauda pacifica]
MYDLLKFRYFLLFFLIISCRDAPKKSSETLDTNDSTESIVTEETSEKVILFFGDSLTAGYGLELEEAFPALIQNRLDSLGLEYTVINSGLSGETTSGGRNRLDWVLNQKVDVFVLELGANDGLRGIPLTETLKNLQAMIDVVKKKNVDTKIILAGMQIPPNMGPEYTTEFRKIFPELAEENQIALIPFLLDGVAGIPELNLEDGIHPTPEGHQIVRDNVWSVLKTVIE